MVTVIFHTRVQVHTVDIKPSIPIHRTSYIKFTYAQQALTIYSYKNARGKRIKIDADFCFDRICKINQSGDCACMDDL
jgi:hypothetical protein